MTFEDLLKQLTAALRTAASLLETAGSHPDGELPGEVRPLRDPGEDTFLREWTEKCFRSLALLHEELSYLSAPVCGEYRLELLPGGRYGFFDKDGKLHSFSCGKAIEAKIHDSRGRQHWVKSRIEHNGSDYFLWEYPVIPLTGLTVREREVAL